jgi:hypothetical protein
MGILYRLALVDIAAASMAAQSTPPARFEEASVKIVDPRSNGMVVAGRMTADAGRLTYTNVGLKAVLIRAYKATGFCN